MHPPCIPPEKAYIAVGVHPARPLGDVRWHLPYIRPGRDWEMYDGRCSYLSSPRVSFLTVKGNATYAAIAAASDQVLGF